MRLGLLSTARINGQILRAAASTDRVVVTAVASRDEARAAVYAGDHGLAAAYGSYEDLLEGPDVDAVHVSLPNGLHHEWSLRALSAGKHVLCEKPYSRYPEEVEEAFEAARRGGLVLMEAFMYRHHPQIARALELFSSGAIGRLRVVRSSFTFECAPGDVRLEAELGGGALMDVGCYCVNGSRLLAGEPHAVVAEQVVASSGVDATFASVMRHEDDVLTTFECSLELPRRQRLEAEGDEGTLVLEAPWRADWGGDILLCRGDDVERVVVPAADSYRLELENLADAIEGKATPLLGVEDALGQARTIEALYRAANDGRAVDL